MTVSEKAGRWFISVQVKESVQEPFPIPLGDIIGIDVGIKTLASCSDGRIFENPKVLYKHEERLKRLQRKLARQKKGSNNRAKTKKKIASLHMRIANIRKDNVHKSTSSIAKTKQLMGVVVEDLHIKGMVKNHKLAKSIHDASMGMFVRQMEYKAFWNRLYLQKVDRFFPSSKTCSNCNNKKEKLALSERNYHCEKCGFKIDRDLNAAINLQQQFR